MALDVQSAPGVPPEPDRARPPGRSPRSPRPWVFRMRWHDLLFAHWPVLAETLEAQLPPGLELDLYEGQAWLGVVPFRMSDVAPRFLPQPPIVGAFPEINVRTYVRERGRPGGDGRGGVWFFSLDAASRLAVAGARAAFHLPYFAARMTCRRDGAAVVYDSERTDGRGAPARFVGRYAPAGPVRPATAGSLEAWLTDRMCLYAVDRAGRLERSDIEHGPWPLQPATAEIDLDTMAEAAGITLPGTPPLLHFARRLDVRGWWPVPVAGAGAC